MIFGASGARNTRRRLLMVIMIWLIGAVIGGSVGYLGDIIPADLIPLSSLNNWNSSPLTRTIYGMARISELDATLGACEVTIDSPETVAHETSAIESVQASATQAKLTPPLDVARAIAAYRSAVRASSHSDPQALASAVEHESELLQAAGWVDTSHDHFASVVRGWDGCSSQNASAPGAK